MLGRLKYSWATGGWGRIEKLKRNKSDSTGEIPADFSSQNVP
jgi:hypothetical protein